MSALFFALFDGIDEDKSEAIDVRELQRDERHVRGPHRCRACIFLVAQITQERRET